MIRQGIHAVGNSQIASLLVDYLRRDLLLEVSFFDQHPSEARKTIFSHYKDNTYPGALENMLPVYLGKAGCFCSELLLLLIHDIVSRRSASCFGNIALSEQGKVHQSVCALVKVLLLLSCHRNCPELLSPVKTYFGSSQWQKSYVEYLQKSTRENLEQLQKQLGYIDKPPRTDTEPGIAHSKGMPSEDELPSTTTPDNLSEDQESLRDLLLLDQALKDVKEQMRNCDVT